MCGIFSFLGYDFDIENLYKCLLILQNRGYDSAGISSIIGSEFLIHKYASTEKDSGFELLKPHLPKHQHVNNFISHVRYSCIGVPSDRNSHPHMDFSGKFSLVHNGIIENYSTLKAELISQGVTFKSETDTEVIVNLIGYYYSKGYGIRESIDTAIHRLSGTWGLVIQCLNEPGKLFCSRHGSPLLIGFGDNFVMISSEQGGFAQYVKNYISLNNQDIIELVKTDNKVVFNKLKDYHLQQVNIEHFEPTPDPYPHWTLKEIHEQVEASLRTMGMGSRIQDDRKVRLGGLDSNKEDLLKLDNLILLGCGTSYHAGLYSSHLFKQISGFNTVQVIDGAEFDRSDIPKIGRTGLILLSQSGETKDLHRCVDVARQNDLMMIGVINVVDSIIAREVHCGVYLNAGKEIGVASTKCFTSQIIALSMIACWFSQNRSIHEIERIKIIQDLRRLPYDIKHTLSETQDECLEVAKYLVNYHSAFLLGKGKNSAIALEGALKIKEIGYINSNGWSTSSLKHGSYALLEKGFPVVILLPDDIMLQRNHSVGDELKSRSAFVVSISDVDQEREYDINITVPKNEVFFGVLSNVCLQLIAYHTAILKGNKVDTPKNLCKTVTVD